MWFIHFLILGFLTGCLFGSSDYLDTNECPLPGGPSTNTEEVCGLYSSCEWVNSTCIMLKNDVAGYSVVSGPQDTGRGFTMNLQKIDPSVTMFNQDIANLVFEAIYHEDYHLQVKIYDADQPRYEVPLPLNLPDESGLNPLYTISVNDVGSPFTFTVTRNSTGTNIFKSMGPLVFEDQFIQISSFLSSEYVYGLGENPHATFKHNFDSRITNPIFPRDQPVGTGEFNQYGYQPYYVNVEDDLGNTNSVLLYSSNAMEYSTFSTSDGQPSITFRTIGGIIDLHFFLGPLPEDVNMQYALTTGTANSPPYWSLGFILSRYGYETLDNLKTVRQRMKDLGIPQDGQTCDIDYMYHERDFTYDTVNWDGFPEFVDELHADGIRLTLMFDPALVVDFSDNYPPSKHGLEQDVFIKWMSEDLVPEDQPPLAGSYMVGYVWPDNKTVFPDFMKPSTHDWWSSELATFHDVLPFDAIWIDMNEPANFGTNLDRPFNYPDNLPDWSLKCPFNNYDSPPFPTKATYQSINECQRISDKTICMSGTQTDGTNNYIHYDVHSIYGITETIATSEAMTNLFPGEKQLLLSRSTYVGSGKYAAHWLGDNNADWLQMRMSIVGLMEFSLFNIPHAGADICGFFNEPSEELCARWMQLGAFYPFSRNHNTLGTPDQDPARPDWPIVNSVSRDVLLLRYKYLPHLYTLFHMSHMHGESVVRPLFNEFYTDTAARSIDDQFMWGESIMIAPVVYEAMTSRNAYFPEAWWYDLVDGTLTVKGPATLVVDAPIDKIPVYIRGGYIVPYQYPNVTTDLSRTNPLGLNVAIGSNGGADGKLYWDDGHSIVTDPNTQAFMGRFDFENNVLAMTVMHNPDVVSGLILETVDFYGYPGFPLAIDVNGVSLGQSDWTYDATTDILSVTITHPLSIAFNMTIS